MRIFDFRMNRKGTTHYYEARMVGLTHGETFVLLRNMDSLKKQMYSLQKSRELFRVTIRSLADGVIITDRQGLIQEMNEAVSDMIGVSSKDVEGRAFWEVIVPRSEGWVEQRKNMMRAVFQERKTARIEEGIAVACPGGEIRVLTLYYSPIVQSGKEELWGGVLIVRDVTSQYDWKNKVKFLSFHDRLTGLYNRAFWEEELRRIEREDIRPLSVINMDMNGLKLANDGFGHEQGDRLLKNMAGVLQTVCRRDDLVARCGGDEFSVILPGAPEERTRDIVSRIESRIAEVNEDGGMIPLSVAIGTATLKGGESPQAMISRADEAMYENKLENRSAFRDLVCRTFLRRIIDLQFGSSRRVKDMEHLAHGFGEYIGLEKADLARLLLLSVFADVGILEQGETVPDSGVMASPSGKERFAVAGYRIALTLPRLSPVAEEILNHHEKWDGTGVPRGISGENIPFLARIVGILHNYFFIPPESNGIEVLLGEKGAALDPSLVDGFLLFLRHGRDAIPGESV